MGQLGLEVASDGFLALGDIKKLFLSSDVTVSIIIATHYCI